MRIRRKRLKKALRLSREDGGSWSAWETLATPAPNGTNSGWSRVHVDLTVYAGQEIRFAFYHTAQDNGYGGDEGPGWYVDEVDIWQGVSNWTGQEDFESGWGGWYADNGVWDIGAPTSGPGSAHEGAALAGTNLSGNYPVNTDSRLISPVITLPGVASDELLLLRFWQWFSYHVPDYGQVQISSWDGGSWSAWETLATPAPNGTNSGWSRVHVDLTVYAGQEIRFAFYHTAQDNGYGGDEGPGWYVDEVDIWQGVSNWTGQEDFESGWGGWYAETVSIPVW